MCLLLRLVLLHTQLRRRPVIQLSARRQVPRQLELRERSLRLAVELAVYGAGVETQGAQLFLYLLVEVAVAVGGDAAGVIRNGLLGMHRGEGIECDGAEGHQQHHARGENNARVHRWPPA
jgi:hypothetical protein